MKKENKILMIIAIILIMLACKTAQVLPPKPVTLQTKERVAARLVPLISPADSAYIAALFECDSSKQVVLRQLSETKSKGVASDYSLKGGVFEYKIRTVHDTIYVPVVDSSLYKEVPVPYAVPGPEINVISGFQWVQIYAGRVFLGLALVFGIFKFLKSKSFI